MQRQSIFITFILSLFIFAGWAGYAWLGNVNISHNKQNASVSTPSIAQSRNAAKPEAATPIPSNQISTSKFGFSGWKIDNTSDQPKACINFTQGLSTNDGLKIIDYIRTEPMTKLTADISGKLVCLSGLKFGQDYQLTLLKGLPSANEKYLAKDKIIDIAFGDRPPFVSFVGSGVILPRIGAQGLAIETVNIETLDIEIFRVGDRILARRSPQVGTSTPEGDYSYEYSDAATEVRESIWKGTLPVKSLPNTLVTTVLPLNELVGELKPGAYVVNAGRPKTDVEYRTARAWRWIISTDLAMTTYQSSFGLDVSLRSIDTARSITKARIDLVAQNNEILESATSDKNGRVHFAKALLKGRGVLRPRMLMAYGTNGDYAVLDFNRAPLDLSAFAIGGRDVQKDIDAYVFMDRGVYRPGETAHLTAMLRGRFGKAVQGRVGQFRFMKPNGIEFRKVRFTKGLAGTVLQDFTIPKSAPRGVWWVSVEIDGMGQVGRAEFSVEDFVPQKLSVEIKIDDAPLRKSDVRSFEISSQFLYGANGSGLEAEGEARIRIDPKPFPSLKDYSFGKVDENFRELFLNLGGGTTDGKGILELGLSLKTENIETSHPLRAEITVGTAEPGGRYVKNSTRIPVRTQDIYLGMKPDFDGRVERNKPFSFNLKAVDWQGKLVSLDNVEWVLVEEDWHYNWYRRRGDWRYRREVRDIERARGSVNVGTDGVDIGHTLNWGDYRLIVRDKASGAESSYRFYVGWGGSSTSDAPDQLKIGVPSTPAKSGQTITLTVKAPYAGIGELVLANDKVLSIRTVKIPKGGSDIKVKLGRDISAGVYAMLTVYTPRSIDERPVPRRAVGIGYISMDVSGQKLDVHIENPKIVEPRQQKNITIRVDNIPRGEKVWMTLAAIDEGVLQITKYKSPDPQNWYFGKKALSIDVRDDYARLLNPNLGQASIAKSGSDSLGGEGLTKTPIKVVSLYNGPVKIEEGRVIIPIDLPDFNGELRLMAVAWSDSALGSDSQAMKVRDAVPTILALPRFMAPGDKAIATLSLDNVDGKSGAYTVLLTGSNALSIDGTSGKIDIEKGERKTATREIIANANGISEVNLTVKGPSGYKTSSTFEIQTRSAFLPISRMTTRRLAAGQSLVLDTRYYKGLDPASVDINVSFTNTPNLDPTAYAASVSRYPYGCTEQTISAAMPL
ncbi:MAG: alpha-2-macroglobulin family protein, partial [Robiginitomaculum sp.]|nr:alpha-2-macroglobulin family protein [Robiginitomaculum sp.]